MVEELKDQVIGENPWSRNRLWQKMYRPIYSWGRCGLSIGVMGAIEVALWDICGKEAGRPVFDLLGGRERERVPVYASGGLKQSLEGMVREAESYVEEGYRAVKVRLLEGKKVVCG
jgi:L-alanine-DL-glutamate epimerase-like enolase superfamily enzyme